MAQKRSQDTSTTLIETTPELAPTPPPWFAEALVVLVEEWTTENGLLTPTMKLRRAAIEKKYNDRVNGWYAEKKEVLWA